jgi:hypothetical protein
VRVRGSPNEKKSQLTKETATGKKENKVRKRETMCEITHRKAKKKTNETQNKCDRIKENVNKTL